jgi:hypothetical protein
MQAVVVPVRLELTHLAVAVVQDRLVKLLQTPLLVAVMEAMVLPLLFRVYPLLTLVEAEVAPPPVPELAELAVEAMALYTTVAVLTSVVAQVEQPILVAVVVVVFLKMLAATAALA